MRVQVGLVAFLNVNSEGRQRPDDAAIEGDDDNELDHQLVVQVFRQAGVGLWRHGAGVGHLPCALENLASQRF